MGGKILCGCVFLLSLFTLPCSAAIRLSQPQSASGEIDLGLIPDSRTSVFLRVRPGIWTQFLATSPPTSPAGNQISSQILDHISSSMDSSMASIFQLCFAPAVDEFLVAKWPSRYSWEVEQTVWMIGLALKDHAAVDPLVNTMIASCSPGQGLVNERKLRGYPLTSLILPGQQLHLLKGDHHLLISPNMFLIQGYLESLDSPPEPPSMVHPDALIGWRPDNKTPNHFLARRGIDRFEISVQSLPVGLEIRLAAKSFLPSARRSPFRPLNPDLLDSIPTDADLVVAGGGLDLLSGGTDGTDSVDQPYAFGVEIPEGKGNSPRSWNVGGAVERPVAVATSPAPVSQEISDRLGCLLNDLGPLGKDMQRLVIEDRIVFGAAAQGSPPGPEPQGLKEHFAELAKDAILAGVVSPDFLVLPLYWEVMLTGESGKNQEPWLHPDWRKEVAPLEFSINHPRDGFEIRLLSSSPASYVILLADFFFFLHMEYAGEWESLIQAWKKAGAVDLTPPPPSPNGRGGNSPSSPGERGAGG